MEAQFSNTISRIGGLGGLPLFVQKPKIAFLFLARNRLPLDLVWDQFFQGDNENRFSIYVHSRPGFLLNRLTTRSRYFWDRQVNNSIQIYWGEATMIQAEIILLRHALMDPSNERFAFVSDSCIPLYNFSYTYDYIMSTSTSFVDSFADTKEGRYNPKMDPVINVNHWRKGSQGDNENRFSIYVHSRPGFLLNRLTTRSRYFWDRQVNNSIQIYWGEATMIQAEIILLRHALMDPSNERFAFVSDSCIPLYNFSYTYDYIMSTSTSFVDSFADTKEGRYNPKMDPVINVNHWRKGSQRKSLPEFWRDRPVPADNSKEHNCIPDEHYVATLLALLELNISHNCLLALIRDKSRHISACRPVIILFIFLPATSNEDPPHKGLEGELTRRSLTHTSWDISSSKGRERQGWHPVTYKLADATPMLVQSIKDIDNIYYETEYRREWCTSKGKPSSCFLFARKFTRPAAMRLLNMESRLRSENQRPAIISVSKQGKETGRTRTQATSRKAIGAIKNRTAVNSAKISCDYKELDINIVNVTNHVERPAK
ncbi:core-2/I-branching beta-1,6-N-acetylglucosaminyltransferase family protein [Artemisia annua]|uniref:Core-2/I-branching beta-1,6-N-acetylglucosaminyltransferase family protein n=1 Tax=Artemisia annua TaxID=35608 RepID=A0A2U1PII2_ARTAN|nr:core-2/I-branching beta-1,6-N-acetylglucosaminyltransferase family protein [Artemisia annua]